MKAREFTLANLRRVEQTIYLVCAGMLSVAAFVVFGEAIYDFITHLIHGSVAEAVVGLLENILLALMLVELLHTLTVSIECKGLRPEPFLIVALVAAVRRILAISVEGAHLIETDLERFNLVMLEIGILAGLILILVVSIYIMRRIDAGPPEAKAGTAGPGQANTSDNPEGKHL